MDDLKLLVRDEGELENEIKIVTAIYFVKVAWNTKDVMRVSKICGL
jgi:hypothetical protein